MLHAIGSDERRKMTQGGGEVHGNRDVRVSKPPVIGSRWDGPKSAGIEGRPFSPCTPLSLVQCILLQYYLPYLGQRPCPSKMQAAQPPLLTPYPSPAKLDAGQTPLDLPRSSKRMSSLSNTLLMHVIFLYGSIAQAN